MLKVNLYKSIAANSTIPVRFRRRRCETFTLPQARSALWRLGVSSAPEKPRWVLIGLQTGKSDNQESNAAIFDHCNLTNMQVCLNYSRYLSANMATDFVKADVYKSFCDFASIYYGIDNLLAGSQVNPDAYKTLYPIHVVDVSKQSERSRGQQALRVMDNIKSKLYVLQKVKTLLSYKKSKLCYVLQKVKTLLCLTN